MTLQAIPSEYPHKEGKFDFLIYQCEVPEKFVKISGPLVINAPNMPCSLDLPILELAFYNDHPRSQFSNTRYIFG